MKGMCATRFPYNFAKKQIDVWVAEGFLNPNDNIVCLHARTSGYARHDDDIQSYRNCSLENYKDAIDYLMHLGF